MADHKDIDVLIIGGGFAGVHSLYRLRKQGFKAKLFEAAEGLAGIWRNACYPGARVDSELPIYGFKFPEVYRTWNFSCRYPGFKEIRKYFDHVDKVLDLSKDCTFNCPVREAKWNEQTKRWDCIVGKDGSTQEVSTQYLIICTGFASKINWPTIPNRETFKGDLYHSGTWPEGLEAEHLKGKNIAVVGSGASGVQLTQALGEVASKMTVFIRTPNLTLPMKNPQVTPESQELFKDAYDAIFEKRRHTFGGFAYDFHDIDWKSHSAEEREAFYEGLWNRTGFVFWLSTYNTAYGDKECNDTMYDFWYRKTAPQIKDEKKREILCPPLEKQYHTFGTVRPSLQTHYYEILNQDNVDVVSVKKNPIKTFTETGVELEDGTKKDFDVIVLATGYDTHTGGFKDLKITGQDGLKLMDHWADGPVTYLGLSTAGFPNMFSLYSAGATTAYSNGPSTTDVQADWVCDFLEHNKEHGIQSVVPTTEAEETFTKRVDDLSAATLFHVSHGWYMGRNVPGKAARPLNYTGGIPAYIDDLEKSSKNDYEGWIKSK